MPELFAARAGLAQLMQTLQPGSLGAAATMFREPVGAEAADGEMPSAVPARQARFPCSPAQRRFWVLDRIDPGTPALNIAARWRLDGRVSSADLSVAFAQIIARHQPLRMFIAEEDGEPVQVIDPFLSFHIPDIDLTGLEEDEAFAEAERIAQLEARASFDLSVPPLIRVTHLRVRDNVSIVLVTAHQLVCDGGSLRIMARELGTISAALHAGRTPALPVLPIGYGEYSARQARGLPQDTLRCDEEFWKQSLRALKHFELQPDHARPAVQTSNGNIVSLLLDRDVTDGLLEVSRRCGCTLFTTTLAALFTLLHRYSGESDLAIGNQVSGRDEAELENVVGLFINTIVLRGDLSGDPTFEDLLYRVRDAVAEDFKHLTTTLDRLIEILNPKRDLSRNALFSVNFVFQNSFIKTGTHGGFTLVELPPCSAGAMYDLNFSMVERPDGWCASCEYNADLFEAETALQLLGHFANLLRAVAADSAQKISTMPMLGDAERHTLAVKWNQSDADYPEQLTLPQLFESQARRTPDAVAVVCGERSLSYRELDLASNRLANELQRRGIGHASRVAICLDRSADLVVALLAVLKAGGAYIPLDPAYPSARLAQIVEDALPAAVLTRQVARERLPASAALIILLDADAGIIERQPESPPAWSASPEDLAYVIYTSGSTGRPKGVQIQHRALTNLLWSMRSRPGLAAKDTLVAVTTVSFDIAALELFLPLIVGARLVVAQEEETGDGAALLQLLRRHQANVMQATPVTWQILLAAGWQGVPSLKMLCGGEAMSRTLADQLHLPGCELWNMYGPTETTIWSSALRVEPGAGPVPIGPPIANTRLYVLDPHGQLLPTGAPGELCIGGDGVALGYLNMPELTRERFVPDPFRKVADDGRDAALASAAKLYRTGDRVRQRQRGTIEFLGRSDDQIKLRGFRIELGDIESVLRAHPQVADGIAVAAADASGERAIRAYAVAPDVGPEQRAALVDSLRSAFRQALPGYMCPSFIIVLDALPRTPNGKIDRASLPMPGPTGEKIREPGQPGNELERRLAKIWSTVLGGADVAADANFFEVGGHSLLAVRLLARIEIEFGQRLSLATLFKNPTIAEQARLLAQAESGSDPRAFDFRQVVKLQANGSRPPLIAINNTGIYFALSKCLGLEQPFTSLQLFDPSLPSASLPRTLEDIAAAYAQLIRRVQRTGPYALLGWCVAGTLAFEVARQLTAAGERVSQLILFDTLAPGHLQRLPWPRSVLADYAYRWQLIAADWAKAKLGKRRLAAFLENRTVVKKLIRGFARNAPEGGNGSLAHGQPLSPEQYDQWLLRYLEDAAASYEPRPYSGTMTLFRSSKEPAGRFLDPQMGWGGFAESGLEVVVIDGDHFSIFQEPSVSLMAQRIESTLRAAQHGAQTH